MDKKYIVNKLIGDIDYYRYFKIGDSTIYFTIFDIIYDDINLVIGKEMKAMMDRTYYYNGGKEKRELYSKDHPEILKHYRSSDKRKKYLHKYQKSSSYKKYRRKYNKTEAGKQAMRRGMAKRKRDLGWIPLINNNPFPCKVDYHHINNILVVPIPSITHRSNLGLNHRERCNVWINKLFGFVGVKE